MTSIFLKGLLFGLGLMASGILVLFALFAIDLIRAEIEYLKIRKFYREKFVKRWRGGPRG